MSALRSLFTRSSGEVSPTPTTCSEAPLPLQSLPTPIQRVVEELRSRNVIRYCRENMRSWLVFADPKGFNQPSRSSAQRRVLANLEHYQVNYALITIVILLYAIVTNPLLLIGLGSVLVAYAYLTSRPTPLAVNGKPLEQSTIAIALSILAVLIFVICSGALTVLWSFGVSSTLTLLHAVFRKHSSDSEGGAIELATLGDGDGDESDLEEFV